MGASLLAHSNGSPTTTPSGVATFAGGSTGRALNTAWTLAAMRFGAGGAGSPLSPTGAGIENPLGPMRMIYRSPTDAALPWGVRLQGNATPGNALVTPAPALFVADPARLGSAMIGLEASGLARASRPACPSA